MGLGRAEKLKAKLKTWGLAEKLEAKNVKYFWIALEKIGMLELIETFLSFEENWSI